MFRRLYPDILGERVARATHDYPTVFRPSLILLGLIIGIALGIFYGWQIDPVEYTDTEPASLSVDHKEQYIRLVAAAYQQDHDLDRARTRLAKLKDTDPTQTIIALAQRLAAAGEDANALAALAADLSGGLQPVASVSETPIPTPAPIQSTETPIPPPSISPTVTLLTFITLTPTATPEYDYALVTQEPYCNEAEQLPLIIVDVIDIGGAPLPGVRVKVRWAEGEDGFITGLKPEISASYGDFLMTVGVTYSVQIGTRTPSVSGVTAANCKTEAGVQYPGAVRLVFQRK